MRPIVLAAALLISACGAPQLSAQQTGLQATDAPATSAPAPTNAPTAAALASPTRTPAPDPSPSASPATAEPTARLVLPAASAIPATADAPQATLAPTAAPAARAAPTTTAVPKSAPKPTVAPAAPAQPSVPVRVVISDIGLDGRVVSVGLDKKRIPIVPDHDIGWYNLSARPGEGDNIVLWGHVLRFRNAPKLPAPFAHLKNLKPGAAVKLYDRAGNLHNYIVTKQVWVTPDQVEYILPKGREMVTMVSCIGDKIIQDGEVVDESHRLITIAEPDA
jgi:sortase (surface protein transpeptidase)